MHSVPDEPEDAAAIVGEQVHPVLDGPPERGQGPLDRQQQHLRGEGDEDGPPPPPLGDLGADGAVDGVVVGDLAGAQQVEQAAEAALVRPQHHEVAEEVVPAVHDGSPIRRLAAREQQESKIELSKKLSFFFSEESIERSYTARAQNKLSLAPGGECVYIGGGGRVASMALASKRRFSRRKQCVSWY